MTGNTTAAARFAWAVLLTALLAPVVLIGAAAPAWACSCVGPEHLPASEVVFSGRAVSVAPPAPRPDGMISSIDPVATTFAVDTVYRGDVAAEQVVVSAMSEASCGYEFTTGGTYLVHGNRADDGTVGTGLCSGTGGAPTDLTAADVETLRRGEQLLTPREPRSTAPPEVVTTAPTSPPVAAAPPATAPPGKPLGVVIGAVVAAAAIGIAAVAWLVVRRRRG